MSSRLYRLKPPVGGLMVLTDGRLPFSRVRATVQEVVNGGVKLIQYRPIDLPVRQMIQEAEELLRIVRTAGSARLIVNDRIDVALAVGADGLHLGHSDMPVEVARRIAGVDLLIGATVRNATEAAASAAAGADYLGCGPVFVTRSKNVEAAPMGADGLRAVVNATELPTLAISGINEENVASLAGANPAGVAVLGAVMRSSNPAAAATRITEIIDGFDLSENMIG